MRLLMILGLWSVVAWATAQLQADFSASPTTGCAPLQVSFSNLSPAGSGYSYEWEFGNGSVSTASNPNTVYVNPGSYTVTLRVQYGGETVSTTKENFIVVGALPEVAFELLSDTIGCGPYTVNFNNLSSDPQASELTYSWSFGDGNGSSLENPEHTYGPAGDFDVTLVAENALGCRSSATEPALVHVLRPRAILGVDPATSCSGELEAQFANNSLARSGFTSLWDFGDGTTSTEHAPLHHYIGEGNYSVALTVTDDIGCSSTVRRENLISVVDTKADFTMSATTICPRQSVRFTNTSAHADNFLWRFGDGSTSRSASIQKSYLEPGTYEVWLIADNGVCTDSTMQTLVVERVEADFSVSDEFVCQLPATLRYTDASHNAASYDWRFGSGGRSTAKNPNVTLPEDFRLQNGRATFSDTLIVTSPHGCTSTVVKKNLVEVVLPQVAMTPAGSDPALAGCVPMSLRFSDRTTYASDKDEVVATAWRVGSGAWQSGSSLDVSLTEAGKVPVQLRVTTEKGCVRTQTEQINAGAQLTVNFNRLGSYERCASETVVFEITSPPAAQRTREIWDFGDDAEVALPVPFHDYEKTGQMDVSLTVYNNGCPSTITKSKVVNILGPYATMEVQRNCADPLNYAFSAEVLDATSYQWDFGDGSSLVTHTLNPQHRYAESGNYVVTFRAFNAESGCDYVVTREVYVRQLKADFELSSGRPCLGTTLTLDPSASIDHSPFSFNNQTVRYVWLLPEEGKVLTSMEALDYAFTKKGRHNVSLVVQDANGCRDTLTQELIIYQPAPNFEVNYQTGCMPVTFGFTDLSVSEAPLVAWNWSFGDGASSTEQHPTHDYTQFGSFNVRLEVTDEMGCVHRVTNNQAVRAISPSAAFDAEDRQLCVGDTIALFDISNSDIVAYRWELSDGRVFTEARPEVLFSTPGQYALSLHIEDVHGCEMTHLEEDFFDVQEPPVADFEADVRTANCYPLEVQFSDLSQTPYPGSWSWHFGEGDNLSEEQHPFFIYNRPGKHTVSLISRTSYGCADTIVKPAYIEVGGPYAEMVVDEVVCRNAEVSFSMADARNVYDMQWDFGDGYSATGEEVTHLYSAPGTVNPVLYLRSDADNTCNKAIVDTLEVWDLRARFAFADNSGAGCVPHTALLQNQSLNATHYLWDFGAGQQSTAVDPEMFYSEAGLYPMELIAYYEPLGCSDTLRHVGVEVFPLPVITISPDTLICYGTTAQLRAEGGVSYRWSPDDFVFNADQAETLAAPDENTLYQVEVTDHNGCVDKDSVAVLVQQYPVVYPRDTTLIIGETVALDVSDEGIASYTWTPDLYIEEGATTPNPVFKATETTAYEVAVQDTSACFNLSYPFVLTVEKKYSVAVPDAFTPNGDGINDKVFVQGWGLRELVVFRIYNRFGQVVYESDQLNDGWDGTWKGSPQPAETYSYQVQVRTEEDALLEKNGTLKLIR